MSRERGKDVAFHAMRREDLMNLGHRIHAVLALGVEQVDVDADGRCTSFRGQDGVRRWWDDMLSAFPDIGMEVLEARDLGDLTLTATRIRGHGAGSDVLVEQTLWQVSEWRDKKCVWWGSYASEREALEAAGLRE